MKTLVTFEVKTPDDESVQSLAKTIDNARQDMVSRGYKVRLMSCKLSPVRTVAHIDREGGA